MTEKTNFYTKLKKNQKIDKNIFLYYKIIKNNFVLAQKFKHASGVNLSNNTTQNTKRKVALLSYIAQKPGFCPQSGTLIIYGGAKCDFLASL